MMLEELLPAFSVTCFRCALVWGLGVWWIGALTAL